MPPDFFTTSKTSGFNPQVLISDEFYDILCFPATFDLWPAGAEARCQVQLTIPRGPKPIRASANNLPSDRAWAKTCQRQNTRTIVATVAELPYIYIYI